MNDGSLTIDGWVLLWLGMWALLLVGVVQGVRLVLKVTPMPAARRRSFEQAVPMLELVLAVLYFVSAVQTLFRGHPTLAAVAVLGVLFGGLWLSRHALMDVVTGVFLRTGGSVARGDRVRVDGVDGTVTWLGTRSLAIETPGGEEALIPYSRLAGQSVHRTPRVDGAYRHMFRIEPGGATSPDRIRRLAMLCHWSSAARAPVIRVNEDGEHEVTVFALQSDRGAEIEAFVRKGLRT